MEAFLLSTGIVALAEIGDKTQLLAFVLAAKFRKPVPIVLGILVATIANHAGAGALGARGHALREEGQCRDRDVHGAENRNHRHEHAPNPPHAAIVT